MRLLVLYFLLSISAFANGGGYHYGVEFTGSIAPFVAKGTEQVQILEEDLNIKLHAEHADVKVRYIMQNVSGKKAKVKFGFPVEAVTDEYDYASLFRDEKGQLVRDKAKSEELTGYCRDYSITLDGKKLKAEYLSEPFHAGKVKKFDGSDVLEGIEGWMVSRMKLASGEKTIIEISYKSDYDVSSYYVSDDGSIGPWEFKYRLSSGGIWAGPIGKGRVTVQTADSCDPKLVKIAKPVNSFKKQDHAWVWEFTNLEPTLASDIVVHAHPQVSSHSVHDLMAYGSYRNQGDKWYFESAAYTATASSTLPSQGESYKYEAQALNPNESAAKVGDAWSEDVDGDGIGEKVIITLEKPRKLHALSIVNGYSKSKKRFTDNNRVKDCTLIINGKKKVKGKLYDHMREQWLTLGGYKGKVRKVELVIDSVYRGEKYQDTCLSRITLIEKLAKEPKSYGAR